MELSSKKPDQWNAMVAALPGAHIFQTWEWGQFKMRYGWKPFYYAWSDAGRDIAAALILQRTLPLRGLSAKLRVMYVPKGPLCDWRDENLRRRVLSDLVAIARKQGVIFIKVDPDVCLGTGIPGSENAIADPLGAEVTTTLKGAGWRVSEEQIQFTNTVLVDLTPDLETLLGNMKQKTRYNIRLAKRKGVTVRSGGIADLHSLYKMYAETSIRDNFVIRDQGYYETLWSTFIQAGMAEPLLAEVQGDLTAALILFHFADKAWYLYGMSRDIHREKMPNYLLQWHAIQSAKHMGCSVYDLWGAPDNFIDSDPLWGVYRFKEGLAGSVVRHLGAWDYPVRPGYYSLYTRVLPRLLAWMRLRGRERTRRTLD